MQIDAEATSRRRRTAYLAGGAFVLALIVAVALVLVSQAGSRSSAIDANETFVEVEQRGLRLGDPNAPVTVVEFADLQCAHCRDFAVGDLPGIVDDYVRPGYVRMELRLLGFIGEDSLTGREVAAGAKQQDLMWTFAESVYAHQGFESTGYMTEDFLRDQADGVDGLNASAALAAIGSPEAEQYGIESDELARDEGVNETPSFLVGAARSDNPQLTDASGLRGAIDDALDANGVE